MGSNSRARRDAKRRKSAERERRRAAESPQRSATSPGPTGTAPPNAGAPRAASLDDEARAVVVSALAAAQLGGHDLDQATDALVVWSQRHNTTRAYELLESRLLAAVAERWQQGWQPLDVAHLCERRLGSSCRDLLVEAIALQQARARSPLDDRWARHLVLLGASEPADAGGLFVGAQTNLNALWGAVRDAALIAITISRFPRIETHIPPPGPQPVRRGPAAKGSHLDEKVLAKVRALLAKAESTTFEEEADALSSKAQELMARHAIGLAMLAATAFLHDGPTARRIHLDDPYIDAKSLLLAIVAGENRCRAVFSQRLAFSTVLGFESDLDIVELLFTSLLTQASSAMLAAGRHVDRDGTSRTRSFRQSFIVSFAHRIGERLREASAAATADAQATFGEAMLPVLASRGAEVDGLMAEVFPSVVQRRTRASSDAGWTAGRQAADKASIKPPGQIAPS